MVAAVDMLAALHHLAGLFHRYSPFLLLIPSVLHRGWLSVGLSPLQWDVCGGEEGITNRARWESQAKLSQPLSKWEGGWKDGLDVGRMEKWASE